MATAAYRWLMTAPRAPMVRESFEATPEADEVVVAVAGCGDTDPLRIRGDLLSLRS
jgi:6-hydroxycyclohex-1-ene-1-carbonyl-CoA dehydrogenase